MLVIGTCVLIIYSGLYASFLNTYLKQERWQRSGINTIKYPTLTQNITYFYPDWKQPQLDYSFAFLLHKNDIYEAQPVGFVNCYLVCRKRMSWLPFSPEIEMFPLILPLLLLSLSPSKMFSCLSAWNKFAYAVIPAFIKPLEGFILYSLCYSKIKSIVRKDNIALGKRNTCIYKIIFNQIGSKKLPCLYPHHFFS